MGPSGLNLHLPLAEVASRLAFDAWLARCVSATAACRELEESLCVWSADMQLSDEQFRMVAVDLFVEISGSDIEDLILFAASPTQLGLVDGRQILKLRDRA